MVQISQFYTDKHIISTTYLIYLFTLIIYLNLEIIVYLHINKRSFLSCINPSLLCAHTIIPTFHLMIFINYNKDQPKESNDYQDEIIVQIVIWKSSS